MCPALAACILSGLYLDVGVLANRGIPRPDHPRTDWLWRFDINETRNPYGVVAIGWQSSESRSGFSVRIEARHESSIAANDHGRDSIGAHITWRPFAP